MEDILIVIFQLIFELVLQVLAEVPWDLTLTARQTSPSKEISTGGWMLLSFGVGAAVGGISLLIFPRTLLHISSVRIANLIMAPLISGTVSMLLSNLLAGQGRTRANPKLNATCAACFTFALAMIRFMYAARPGR